MCGALSRNLPELLWELVSWAGSSATWQRAFGTVELVHGQHHATRRHCGYQRPASSTDAAM
jgi:hypothetical protein